MSATRPYFVPDDDGAYDSADSGVELLDYGESRLLHITLLLLLFC
jgi:hypothetical protein